MKVFICWSGELSKLVAAELRDWLPDVIQSVQPFFSEEDIASGTPWFQSIEKEIKDTYFGILCLTQDNKHSHWIHYEAGGLRKGIGESRIVPLLFNMEPTDVEQPLAAFQLIRADKVGVQRLLKSINEKETGDTKLTTERLDRAFNKHWESLESRLAKITIGSTDSATAHSVRSQDDKLDELLVLTRRIIKDELSTKAALAQGPDAGARISQSARDALEKLLFGKNFPDATSSRNELLDMVLKQRANDNENRSKMETNLFAEAITKGGAGKKAGDDA